jgi:glycosyltransferase involved in cell wall biosynthesis
MRIAINLIPFYSIQGIETFAQNIIAELLKLSRDEIFILTAEDSPNIFNFQNANVVKIKRLKGKFKKTLWQQFQLPIWLKNLKIDMLFSPSLHAPIFWKNKIVTIHDCAYDRFPEFDNFLSKIYFKLMFWSAKYFSKKIITVSEFSKKELINLHKINPDKISVIYESVPEIPNIEKDSSRKVLQKFKINKPYFLFIGNTRPRKNILGLIKSFDLFLKNTRNDYLLVIAGKIDKRFIDLNKKIKNMGLENKIILTDFVSQEEKTALYRETLALTFPSFYEGFGLPILEAQSLEIPVLTSNTSSLPEIAGNGALFVNPYNTDEIANNMDRISKDEVLRQSLIKNGLDNIKRFSWKKSAKQLYEIIANK